jgi:hypothetical protein
MLSTAVDTGCAYGGSERSEGQALTSCSAGLLIKSKSVGGSSSECAPVRLCEYQSNRHRDSDKAPNVSICKRFQTVLTVFISV